MISPEGTVLESEAPFDHWQVGKWNKEMEESAGKLAAELARGEPVDLFASYAAPWSLEVAALVAGISQSSASDLLPLARKIFHAAAHATGPGSDPDAGAAAAGLAQGLPPSALGVQTFVALSHTLPHLLTGMWHALLTHVSQLQFLRAEPRVFPQAMEELLRFASPSRTVFRIALTRVEIGGVVIDQGDTVHLGLAAANHDPARFPNPGRLDFRRGQSGHLAFGRGRHACAGAQLIRLAAAAATHALLNLPASIEAAGEPLWLDGAAIRGPASLPVILRPAVTG